MLVDRPEDRHGADLIGEGQVDRRRTAPLSGSCGVRPPCDQIALPISAVMPSATMLIAVPETIWLARWSIEA